MFSLLCLTVTYSAPSYASGLLEEGSYTRRMVKFLGDEALEGVKHSPQTVLKYGRDLSESLMVGFLGSVGKLIGAGASKVVTVPGLKLGLMSLNDVMEFAKTIRFAGTSLSSIPGYVAIKEKLDECWGKDQSSSSRNYVKMGFLLGSTALRIAGSSYFGSYDLLSYFVGGVVYDGMIWFKDRFIPTEQKIYEEAKKAEIARAFIESSNHTNSRAFQDLTPHILSYQDRDEEFPSLSSRLMSIGVEAGQDALSLGIKVASRARSFVQGAWKWFRS
jgi:hypothetical protein